MLSRREGNSMFLKQFRAKLNFINFKNILQKFNDTTDYIKELKKKNLPFGFLERAVNILELRKGYKSDYWNANPHNQ